MSRKYTVSDDNISATPVQKSASRIISAGRANMLTDGGFDVITISVISNPREIDKVTKPVIILEKIKISLGNAIFVTKLLLLTIVPHPPIMLLLMNPNKNIPDDT